MSRLGGLQLARRLLEIRPGIGVVYMTGYAGDTLPAEGAALDEVEVIHKPFTRETLVSGVREALDGIRFISDTQKVPSS